MSNTATTDQPVAQAQREGHGHVSPRAGGPQRCGGIPGCAECQAELEYVKLEYVRNMETGIRSDAERMVNGAYRERTALLAGYARRWPSVLAHSDPQTPNWAVLTIEAPAGQMCWHIAAGDLELLRHVGWGTPRPYDGHSTEEKYRRLAAALEQEADAPLEPVFAELIGQPSISINFPEGVDAEEIARRVASLIEPQDPVEAAPPSPEQVLEEACGRIGDAVASGMGEIVREALLAECARSAAA